MLRILAVDDDLGMQEYYQALLSEAGYEVKTAPDASAALDLFYDFKPDLMVLDVEVPDGGGERIFRTARLLLDSGVPVAFVTGSPERVVDFALTQTKVRVFKKPVSSNELLTALIELHPHRKLELRDTGA